MEMGGIHCGSNGSYDTYIIIFFWLFVVPLVCIMHYYNTHLCLLFAKPFAHRSHRHLGCLLFAERCVCVCSWKNYKLAAIRYSASGGSRSMRMFKKNDKICDVWGDDIGCDKTDAFTRCGVRREWSRRSSSPQPFISLVTHSRVCTALCVCFWGSQSEREHRVVWSPCHVILISQPGLRNSHTESTLLRFALLGWRAPLLVVNFLFFCFVFVFLLFGGNVALWTITFHASQGTYTHTQPRMTCVRIVVVVTTAMCGCCFRSASTSSGIPCWEVGRDTHGECSHKKPTKALYLVSMPIWAPKKWATRAKGVCWIDKNELNCTLAETFFDFVVCWRVRRLATHAVIDVIATHALLFYYFCAFALADYIRLPSTDPCQRLQRQTTRFELPLPPCIKCDVLFLF